MVAQLLEEIKASPETWADSQEVPVEAVPSSIRLSCLVNIVASAVHSFIEKSLSRKCFVPSDWSEVLYIRRKKPNEFTRKHQDFEFFSQRRYVNDKNEPAYTWWCPVSQPSTSASRLRLFVQEKVVIPKLDQGDIVLFHQTMWHDSSHQRSNNYRYSIDGRVLLK